MGREKLYPLTSEQHASALDTVIKLNLLEVAYGNLIIITSGYRPGAINDNIAHAVHGDAHEKCKGADLRDRTKSLSAWCVKNIETLIKIGFWLESPSSAIDHVHVQTYPPHSGNRVFIA